MGYLERGRYFSDLSLIRILVLLMKWTLIIKWTLIRKWTLLQMDVNSTLYVIQDLSIELNNQQLGSSSF